MQALYRPLSALTRVEAEVEQWRSVERRSRRPMRTGSIQRTRKRRPVLTLKGIRREAA